MKHFIVLLALLNVYHLQNEDEQITHQLEVPIGKQVAYVRKLAAYHFRKSRWHRRFAENECPEFEEIVWKVKEECVKQTHHHH